MRSDSSAQKRPASDAKSLAMPASMSERSPASFSRPALSTSIRAADAAGGDVHAAELERVHHLREALVQAGLLAAEDVLGRARVAVEHQLGRLDALVAHLLELRRDGEAGVVA